MPTADSPYAGMTPEEFLTRQPQFRRAGNDIISAAIAKAAELLSADAYGNFYEQAVEYKACDLLASGAYGQLMPPLPKEARTVYQDILNEITLKIPRRGLTT